MYALIDYKLIRPILKETHRRYWILSESINKHKAKKKIVQGSRLSFAGS